MTEIILASTSPRRGDLLASLGLVFAIVDPAVDENHFSGEDPESYVVRVARSKAEAVATAMTDQLIIAADTTVALDGDVVGKPLDRLDAARILRVLSGRTHTVFTGVALALAGRMVSGVVATHVSFCQLSDAAIAWYVGTGEPDDKAGAYGMQGAGNVFVEHVDGSPSNVIGLPLALVRDLATDLGIDLLQLASSPGRTERPSFRS